jgi:glucose-1-phosphate thymidylyltransferase
MVLSSASARLKGIVLAGGTGSRLLPLTCAVNKHLLPVGRVPMVLHPIRKLAEAGIREIMLVTGKDDLAGFGSLLGSGAEHGVELAFRAQDRPGGIGEALLLGERFAANGPVAMILGDNIFEATLEPIARRFAADPRGARVVLKSVDDPTRFGVATVADGRIVRVVEKPASPESDLAVTGIYFFDEEVFDILRGLAPSARGELEIADVLEEYVRAGTLGYDVLEGAWVDAGTFEGLEVAQRIVSSA